MKEDEIKVIERRKSLRSYGTQKSREHDSVDFINDSLCYMNDCFTSSNSECPLPKLPWADPLDVWERMKRREIEYRKDSCYMQRHPNLQVRMRSILLDWLIEVLYLFGAIVV